MHFYLPLETVFIVVFGRALRATSRLNPEGALLNNFSKRSDSTLILWSDFLKKIVFLFTFSIGSIFIKLILENHRESLQLVIYSSWKISFYQESKSESDRDVPN